MKHAAKILFRSVRFAVRFGSTQNVRLHTPNSGVCASTTPSPIVDLHAVLRSDLWALPALGTGHRLAVYGGCGLVDGELDAVVPLYSTTLSALRWVCLFSSQHDTNVLVLKPRLVWVTPPVGVTLRYVFVCREDGHWPKSPQLCHPGPKLPRPCFAHVAGRSHFELS